MNRLYVSFLSLLLLFGTVFQLSLGADVFPVVLLLLLTILVIITSELTTKPQIFYVSNVILFIIYTIYPSTLLLFPTLISYDLYYTKNYKVFILFIIGYLLLFSVFVTSTYSILTILLTIPTYWFTVAYIHHNESFVSYEQQLQAFENKNHELQQSYAHLMETKQEDMEIAQANERTRIARDIHDNVGHLLSRSIIQIGAIRLLEGEQKDEQLELLDASLNEAMSSVRNSIHDLHNDNFELGLQLKTLCNNNSIPTTLTYRVQNNLSMKENYQVLAIVKEAITNTNRHSNATMMSVSLIEQPGFYQLQIKDNGTTKSNTTSSGIGMFNMEARVQALHGRMNIYTKQGFTIFITFEREETI